MARRQSSCVAASLGALFMIVSICARPPVGAADTSSQGAIFSSVSQLPIPWWQNLPPILQIDTAPQQTGLEQSCWDNQAFAGTDSQGVDFNGPTTASDEVADASGSGPLSGSSMGISSDASFAPTVTQAQSLFNAVASCLSDQATEGSVGSGLLQKAPVVGDQSATYAILDNQASGGYDSNDDDVTVLRVQNLVALLDVGVATLEGSAPVPVSLSLYKSVLRAWAALDQAAVPAPTTTTTSPVASTIPPPSDDCTPVVSAAWEKDLKILSLLHVSVPENAIHLPANLGGQITVAVAPGEMVLCANGIVPALDDSELALAQDVGISTSDSSLGPFEYSLSQLAWLADPAMPANQALVSHFSSALKAQFHLTPQISLSQAGASLELGSIAFEADLLKAELLDQGSDVLTASISPSVEVTASISKEEAEGEVEDDVAQGETESTAEADVADETAGSIGEALKVEGTDFYPTMAASSGDVVHQFAVDAATSLDQYLSNDSAIAAQDAEDDATAADTDLDVDALDAAAEGGETIDAGDLLILLVAA